MKWMLFLVFINTAGGVTTEKLPMATEDQCGAALKAVSAGMFETDKRWPRALLSGATCFEVGR